MPKIFDIEKVTPEAFENIKSTYSKVAHKLDKELGRAATFRDLIYSRIELTDYTNVEEKFNVYKYAWSTTGRSIENADEIYFELANSFKSMPSEDGVIAHNDAIIESITEHPYKTDTMYEDSDYLPEKELCYCYKCNKSFYGWDGLCDKCSKEEKILKTQEENEKKPRWELIIGGILLYLFLWYQIGGFITFIVGGAIGLLALMYISDKEGWNKK
ncbi:hypothetical protein [Leptobacterium sp. I13]|uniref:hypothetical protein n=1 Tax=Leptobacterium meishanense TaxID=3128904 RepID=UPI0030EC95C7